MTPIDLRWFAAATFVAAAVAVPAAAPAEPTAPAADDLYLDAIRTTLAIPVPALSSSRNI